MLTAGHERGGGKNKDKRNRAEKKQAASSERIERKSAEEPNDEGPAIRECYKDAVIRVIEERKEYLEIVERVSEVTSK